MHVCCPQIGECREELRGLDTLVSECKAVLDEDHTKGLLSRATNVRPLVKKQEDTAER